MSECDLKLFSSKSCGLDFLSLVVWIFSASAVYYALPRISIAEQSFIVILFQQIADQFKKQNSADPWKKSDLVTLPKASTAPFIEYQNFWRNILVGGHQGSKWANRYEVPVNKIMTNVIPVRKTIKMHYYSSWKTTFPSGSASFEKIDS